MIKIAIDLSSTVLGYCCLDQDNYFILSGIIEFLPFGCDNFEANAKKISTFICFLFERFKNKELLIGFELTNFKSAMVSNRHNYYMGAVTQEFINQNTSNKLVFKFFNANAWHCLFGWNNKQRNELKQLSCEFFESKIGYKPKTDDEADAFCICWTLEKIKTTEQTKIEVGEKKKLVLKNKKELVKLQAMLIARMKKKQTPKVIKEIEEINKKIMELKNE